MSAGFGEDAARQQTLKQTERDTDGLNYPLVAGCSMDSAPPPAVF